MTGRTYINDIDIYQQFGVFVTQGGYNGLVSYPPLKKPEFNDWHEDDGIEVDLSDPKLDTKTFDITFGIENYNNLNSFIDLLTQGAYHDFRFEEIKFQKRLRLVLQTDNKILTSLGTFKLKFADDFPLEGFVPDVITPSNKVSGFEIDNKDLLSSYKVQVLQGIISELEKSPDTKQNLLVNTASINGASYDSEIVKLKEKQLKVKCLYLAELENQGRFWWQDYYSLLNDLVQSGERLLFIQHKGIEHSCYYQSMKMDKFFSNDKVWCEFTLNLILTSVSTEIDVLLATEDGIIVVLEDRNCAINMV